jgi:hypothetical protein
LVPHRRTTMSVQKSAHISICHTSSIICPCICNLQNRVGKVKIEINTQNKASFHAKQKEMLAQETQHK